MEVRLIDLRREATLSCSKPTPQLRSQSLCAPLAAHTPLSIVDPSHKFKMRMTLRPRNDGYIVTKLNCELYANFEKGDCGSSRQPLCGEMEKRDKVKGSMRKVFRLGSSVEEQGGGQWRTKRVRDGVTNT
ncbi:hypothetical protein TSUD_226430 [Trifolium subterraneum]|uniref:Uncharacterized protein n=1 Tax=Trifolium subterraneum TaxID=3900 RepID=A0A2Z6NNU3_TRISU|nr:hypothetical protein TSUD_226430 [Trifolium subterraneum]